VLWPAVTFWRPGNPGVPFKDQVTQSAEFAMCAFGLGAMAIAAWRASHHGRAVALAAGALAFLGNVALVATSRAELVVVAVLAVLLGAREFGWKGLTSSIVAVIVAAGIAWSSAGYLRGRIDHAAWEVRQYVTTNAPTSAGLRLEWLRKSVEFVTEAPIIGHGTGTIAALFRASAIGKSGAAAAVTDNPHNQILTVAIQLGAVGTALLIAMWVAHLTLFRGPAPAAWLGLVVVVQNVVAAPFHSHLLDFTEGWLYIWGVGVIGALVRGAEPARPFDGKQSLNGDLSRSPGRSP
jgi:hypothetical protein